MAKKPAARSAPRPARSARSSKSGAGGKRFRRLRLALWVNLVLLVVGGGWYFVQPPARQAEVRLLVGNAFASNKRVSLLDVAGDIYQLYYSPDFVSVPPVRGDRTHLFAGAPRVAGEGDAIPAGRFLRNTGYVVGYGEDFGSPLWVGYRVKDVDPLPAPAERPERFEVDVRTVARVDPGAYTGSGYDRGHLAPNYAIATRYGAKAQRETFLMSNIIPQRHALNAGLWKQMELRAATSYPARFGEVWVLAGPVFRRPPAARLAEGESGVGVAIPEACFMILADESDGRVRTLAFMFPQETKEGARPEDFLTTIDEIEDRTGLEFFAELPVEIEDEIEAMRATRVW
ncbi:MAG: DNA/RNA non-specific endonuclease [Burkholderiales bacterium]|nr:DNA/RNA non-specific endonuclease [Opitutaceae bacterium]